MSEAGPGYGPGWELQPELPGTPKQESMLQVQRRVLRQARDTVAGKASEEAEWGPDWNREWARVLIFLIEDDDVDEGKGNEGGGT